MNNLFPYLLKVILLSAAMLGFYQIFLKKLTYFRLNRYYLLFSMLLPVFLPLIKLNFNFANVETVSYTLSNVVVNANSAIVADKFNYLLLMYFLIVFVFILIFSISLISILKLRLVSSKKDYKAKQIFVSEKAVCPFSFFSKIFVDKYQYKDKDSLAQIVKHEDVHISQFHSIDIVFSEILASFFWINPFFWMIKRKIKLNHEFIVDNIVLDKGIDFVEYTMLILDTVSAKRFTIANNLKEGLTLKRIKMMKKNRSYKSKKLVYLMIIPLLALTTILISWKDIEDVNIINNNFNIETAIVDQGKNDTIMPQWKNGGTNGLIQYLVANIVYPEISKEQGAEGRVFVKFHIDVDGSVQDVTIEKGVNAEFNKEALRVIETMPNWIPGKINNKKAKFEYVIPINFKLSE